MKHESQSEDIEGFEKDLDSSLGDYPIDTILIRNETRTIFDVKRRIEAGGYIMHPDFQRDFVWDEDKQSKLIESVLMRIPLPVFYLAEDAQGKMIVVDGLQRLTTFTRFINNEFTLKLRNQEALNGKKFAHLSPKLQSRVEDFNLILYLIDAKVPERARLDIFERVNSGEPLTKQQMRNCLYNGAATRFLKAESESEVFRNVTGGSLRPKTMRDRECVNRYCAFRLLSLENYKGDMDEWLAEVLKVMNSFSVDELKRISDEFRKSLRSNFLLFDNQAFRKHMIEQTNRGIFNISLWDVMTVGLSRYSEEVIQSRAENLRTALHKLFVDQQFVDSITYSTNNTGSVKKRFEMSQRVLDEVLNA